jgi:fatty acid desaturase
MARNTRTNRWARTVSIAVLSLLLGAVLLGIAAGVGAQLFWLWLLPAWLASGVLAFAFDWLPHRPHDTTDRWTNARVLDLPVLPFLLLGQSRHLVYPLWPRVPFYRYVMVFRAHRAELEAHGSPIISLDAPPTTPNTGPS